MRVTEFKGTLAFLHEVVPRRGRPLLWHSGREARGAAASVVKRARQVLASLEASRSSGSLDALPLFSYEPREPPRAACA